MNTKFESFSVYFKIEEKPISKNFKMDNGLVEFFPKNVLFFFFNVPYMDDGTLCFFLIMVQKFIVL